MPIVLGRTLPWILGVFIMGILIAPANPAASEPLTDENLKAAQDNPYLKRRLSDAVLQLADDIKQGQFKTRLLNTTSAELMRGIESTGQGDAILAVDYGIDWEGPDFHPYLDANSAAIRRGVTITRVFILSGPPRGGLCRVMAKQQEAGIHVRIADLEQLKQHQRYTDSPHARVVFKYGSRHAVLMIEVIPLPQLKINDAYLLKVIWDSPPVEESTNHITWLSDNQQSKAFKPGMCQP